MITLHPWKTWNLGCEKAVDIANALLRDGYEEGRSIAIATSQAEEWNDNHPAEQDEKPKNMKNSIQAKMYTTIIPLLPMRRNPFM